LSVAPATPAPRGPLSEALIARLRGEAPSLPQPAAADPLGDDDLQLALYCAYELHYRGFAGVEEALEWDPELLAFRAGLERTFEGALRDAVPEAAADPDSVGARLFELAAEDEGPSLSRRIEAGANLEEVREFATHRSAYQLKEADPHTWAIPRLDGPPKSALVEVQADEYGGGRPERMHSRLFAQAMRALGLDDAYGAYLNRIPGTTLATVNLISLFGLHRRLRGALVGHLAMFEITSPQPNRRYANGLRRLGLGPEATGFFDEHVVADSVHENVAAYDLAQGLARAEPRLAGQILWGARCLLELEGRFAQALLEAWAAGRSSLLAPAAAAAAALSVA
jgi:hypothetical protein